MNGEHPPGGRLARQAAMLCQSAEFRLYLDRRAREKFGASVPDGTHLERDARDWLCRACAIGSRAELDHHAGAAATFQEIQRRFQRWQQRQRASA